MSFRRLGEILPQTLEGMGLLQRVRAQRVAHAWPEVARAAAPELAGRTEPLTLQGGVLTVRISDAGQRALLERASPELARALNAAVGEPAVQRVVGVR